LPYQSPVFVAYVSALVEKAKSKQNVPRNKTTFIFASSKLLDGAGN
jgi:hypothetical protein